MLSDRINALFSMLGCRNTDIARYSGCSSGNISKLRTGNRRPSPSSSAVVSLARGVYGYAEEEDMLPALAELCGSGDLSPESTVPALIDWLFGTGEPTLPENAAGPKRKQLKELQNRNFGERFDRAAALTGLSNRRIADYLNIDPSLVSRYRSGICSPKKGTLTAEKVAELLVTRAGMCVKTAELAELCGTAEEDLNASVVSAWLYGLDSPGDRARAAESLLNSVKSNDPANGPVKDGIPGPQPDASEKTPVGGTEPEKRYYFGYEGLQTAGLRLLKDAAETGGEILVFTDEPSSWFEEDRAFLEYCTFMLKKCADKGMKFRIVYKTSRGATSLGISFRRWLPLYIKGAIEPYEFNTRYDSAFFHSIFLHKGHACICGFSPSSCGSDEGRLYEYITDKAMLGAIERSFGFLLADARPAVKYYGDASAQDYRNRLKAGVLPWGKSTVLASGFPVCTMPEELLYGMLFRGLADGRKRSAAMEFYSRRREQFREALRGDPVEFIVYPQRGRSLFETPVNFYFDMINVSVRYTKSEFDAHVAAVEELVKKEDNFRLSLLREPPLQDIQLAIRKDEVHVLYCGEPRSTFVLLNTELKAAFSDYLSSVADVHFPDKESTLRALEAIRSGV